MVWKEKERLLVAFKIDWRCSTVRRNSGFEDPTFRWKRLRYREDVSFFSVVMESNGEFFFFLG